MKKAEGVQLHCLNHFMEQVFMKIFIEKVLLEDL